MLKDEFSKNPLIQLNVFKYKAVHKKLFIKKYQYISGKILKEYL